MDSWRKKLNCHIELRILFGKLLFSKKYSIIKHNSKQLSSVPNDVELIIHAIDFKKMSWRKPQKFPQ